MTKQIILALAILAISCAGVPSDSIGSDGAGLTGSHPFSECPSGPPPTPTGGLTTKLISPQWSDALECTGPSGAMYRAVCAKCGAVGYPGCYRTCASGSNRCTVEISSGNCQKPTGAEVPAGCDSVQVGM